MEHESKAHALRVLVVDDEPGMRSGAERVLRDFVIRTPDVEGELHLDIQMAATGQEALQAIRTNRPDLLLLDLKLPDMNGLEILQQYGGDESGILTVVITAYASIETAVTSTKRGAFDFLAKPFTPDELRAAVQKAARQIALQREAKRLTEERRQVRFHFISVLAHELKSPLAAIEGYLNLMHDHTMGSGLDAYDQVIRRTLVRTEGMRKLIFDLLDMTRIESGQKERRFEPVDLCALARETVETFSAEAAGKNVAIELRTDGPVTMTADRQEIEILLNNLVSNAVKYNREGGKVTVTLRDDRETVGLSVTDTGIGMTDEECGRIFSEFGRIKNAKTRDIQGSGLGLSTVQKLTRLYGGNVTVTSAPEQGSTFHVTLRKDSTQQATQDGPQQDT